MRISLHPHRVWCSSQRLVKYTWNSQIRGTEIDSPPVFLVGYKHSGTSISLTVLGAHSRIHAIPYETKVLEKENRRTFNWAWRNFNLRTIAANKHRWIEKTPNHLKYVQQILDWCPEAKVLLVLRDGRDVAASLKKRDGNLKSGIEGWVASNRESQQFWNHPNVHVYRYEDLITDFDLTLKRILDFLGEDFEPSMRNYHATPRRFYSLSLKKPQNAFGSNHKQHRNWQINQPLFDGRGRWKELSEEELNLIHDIGGELLFELGYINQSSQSRAA